MTIQFSIHFDNISFFIRKGFFIISSCLLYGEEKKGWNFCFSLVQTQERGAREMFRMVGKKNQIRHVLVIINLGRWRGKKSTKISFESLKRFCMIHVSIKSIRNTENFSVLLSQGVELKLIIAIYLRRKFWAIFDIIHRSICISDYVRNFDLSFSKIFKVKSYFHFISLFDVDVFFCSSLVI